MDRRVCRPVRLTELWRIQKSGKESGSQLLCRPGDLVGSLLPPSPHLWALNLLVAQGHPRNRRPGTVAGLKHGAVFSEIYCPDPPLRCGEGGGSVSQPHPRLKTEHEKGSPSREDRGCRTIVDHSLLLREHRTFKGLTHRAPDLNEHCETEA